MVKGFDMNTRDYYFEDDKYLRIILMNHILLVVNYTQILKKLIMKICLHIGKLLMIIYLIIIKNFL